MLILNPAGVEAFKPPPRTKERNRVFLFKPQRGIHWTHRLRLKPHRMRCGSFCVASAFASRGPEPTRKREPRTLKPSGRFPSFKNVNAGNSWRPVPRVCVLVPPASVSFCRI